MFCYGSGLSCVENERDACGQAKVLTGVGVGDREDIVRGAE